MHTFISALNVLTMSSKKESTKKPTSLQKWFCPISLAKHSGLLKDTNDATVLAVSSRDETETMSLQQIIDVDETQ